MTTARSEKLVAFGGGALFALGLVVSGMAQPHSQLTLQGETVKVGRDGRFSTRVSLGDGRQVFPATAISPDGSEQRTIVLAVERNTKALPPQSLDELN